MSSSPVPFEPACLADLSDPTAGPRTAPRTVGPAFAVGRFAGQGHRFAAELQTLHARSEAVQELVKAVTEYLADAARVLKVEPLDAAKFIELVAESEDHSRFTRPTISCPMIGLTQLATLWQAVEDFGLGGLHHVRQVLARGLAGHSQGIISAVAMASARNRVELMRAICIAVAILWLIGVHAEAVRGGMALVEGDRLTRQSLELAVASFSDLHIAGRNANSVFVLSGSVTSLERFSNELDAGQINSLSGCKFRKLRIEAPFHSPMLRVVVPAVVADAKRLDLGLGPTLLPVYTGSGALLEVDPTVERLISLVCSEEINWLGTMCAVGETSFTVEFGPGAPLPLPSGLRLPALAQATAEVPAEPPEAAAVARGALAEVAVDVPKAAPTTAVAVQWDPDEIRSRVSGVLARALGCEVSDVDQETPFFDLGLRSNDLAHFAGALSEVFGGAVVAAHELFDYPTVQQLTARLSRQLAKRLAEDVGDERVAVAGDGPDPKDIGGCITWVLAAALGCDRGDLEPDVHFELLGLERDDLQRIAAALSKRVQMQVWAEDLVDFPTAAALTGRLQRRRIGFLNFGPAWALLQPARVDPGVVSKLLVEPILTLDIVLQVQKKMRTRLSQSDIQTELKRLAAACFPDGEAYLAALHSRVMDEEEKIYRRLGFQSQDTDVLRKKSLRIAAEHIATTPELRLHSKKLVELTWPSDSDRWRW